MAGQCRRCNLKQNRTGFAGSCDQQCVDHRLPRIRIGVSIDDAFHEWSGDCRVRQLLLTK